MEFKDYIESAVKIIGSQKELAQRLDVQPQNLTHAKKNRASIPDEAIFKLAEILNKNPAELIAARQMALAKTEEKRKFWESYLNKAKMISATVCVATFTNLVTPTPASANISTTCLSLNTSNTNYTNHEEGNTGKSWPNLILYAPNLP